VRIAALSTAPQTRVTIIPVRHSRMLVAGIQKESLDARLRGHDGCKLDTQLCGAALSTAPHKFGIRNTAHPARHSREGGNPDGSASLWTPAFVGVQNESLVTPFRGPVLSGLAQADASSLGMIP